jgi:regulator of protease activity HflC (stomatin/prohibitin superfamily)
VLFRLGRVVAVREPGLTFIVPLIDVLRRVPLRIVTMPIQSQGIITRDNVSVDVSAVAYYRVVDPVQSVVAIENVSGWSSALLKAATANAGPQAHPWHAGCSVSLLVSISPVQLRSRPSGTRRR